MAIILPDASWGEPIASWDYSTDVTSVDFTDLGGYRDLFLFFYGVTNDTGTTAALIMRLSTDNGATFISAGSSYANVGSVLTTSLPMSAAVASATTLMGEADIHDLNAAANRTKTSNRAGTSGSGTVGTTRIGLRNTAERNDAIRLLWSGGENFTAGSIRLYGRRG